MRRSVATVSMSGTLRQKLEAIAAARFDAIELFENDFVNFDGSAAALHAMAADLGLGIDLYQPFRDFEGMPDDAFRKSLERAERKFDVMEALGAPLMLVCSNTSPLALDDEARSAAQLHELAERAARRGLRIGYEALAWGRHVNRWRQAWAIVERGDHPHLGLILDSFHTLSLKDDPAGITALPGDRIFFLQMADAPLLSMDVLQWARHHRNFPGQGQFDLENFFVQVLLSGYTGTLSLEIFNDQFRETPNRRTAVDAMRSLLFLESRARQRLERARASTATAPTGISSDAAVRALQRVELFDPPQAEPLDGIAFVEFGAAGADARALAGLLRQLGFAEYGRHRTKDVALFRQGSIQLVLNAEPGSPAHERYEAQGVSVGAIGLATAEPFAAASRAGALLSARHAGRLGAGQLQLPAIVAPGGTIVHFVPSADGARIEADFVAADGSGAAAPAAGLASIDHLAFGLAPDQFDTWILFSRAVLGLERGDSLELADPFGLIRSSGIADDRRKVRFVLNVSLSQRTRTARQVTATGRAGGGVQHIAFATSDIFETMRRLRANGAPFVRIPANYYDDLRDRLDLPEDLVRRMQALDIVYDRTPAGDYLHAYGEPFADRFFFEIVQRNAGYDGYGAVNAAARMASQEQRSAAASPAS